MKETRAILVFLLPMVMASCAGKKQAKEDAAISAVSSPDDWYLVSSDPVKTYFPKGYPEDSPTDLISGEWVVSPEKGARWFIPSKGDFDTEVLQAKALAMRTENDKKGRGVSGDSPSTGDVTGADLFRALIVPPATLGAAMSGHPANFRDGPLYEDWDDPKKRGTAVGRPAN